MKKARVTIVTTIEYDINPKFYKEGITPEECVEADVVGAEEDPFFYLEMEGAEITVTGEVLK